MDNQLPTSGVGGSGKSGMVVVVLAVLAVLALGAFYMLRSGGSVTEEMPAVEDGAVEEAIVVEEGVGSEVGAVEEHVVAIKDFKFTPANITITAGESVTWENDEAGVPHSILLDDGSYKSAAVFAGETETRRFPVTGTYPYHCGIHPTMKGVVIVK